MQDIVSGNKSWTHVRNSVDLIPKGGREILLKLSGRWSPKYENKRLLAIKLADPVPGRRIGLAWRRGFTRPQVIQVIRDAVHELKVPGLRMIAG